MPPLQLYVERHHLPVTSRIEFTLVPPPALPSITPRIEFTPARLAYRNKGKEPDAPALEPRGNGSTPHPDPEVAPPLATLLPRQPSSKIPKPGGEPGRPGSGGFCVETVLTKDHNWTEESLEKLKVSQAS